MKTCGISLLLAFIAFCGIEAANGIERENLRFYLSFENGLQPSIAGEGTQLKFVKGTAADAQLVEGRRGRGLKVTPKLCLQYATRRSFSPRDGTIAFWMKPVGWSGTWHHRYLLFARSDDAAGYFNVYYGNPWLVFAGSKGNSAVGGDWQAAFEKEPFPEGQWTFLAGTFKPGQHAFYINRRLVNKSTDGLVEPEFIKTGVIEIPPGAQVLDEIMVFDRALTAQEVFALYEANTPRAK